MYRDGREANMAEYSTDERFGAAEEAHVGSLAGWLGAGVSLMLLVGITIWGYQVVMRDVNGIPVVRAAQDPMRIAPTDPGGTPAENQGFSVNSVAGDSQSAPLADSVTLAPSPFVLPKEDTSGSQLLEIKLSEDSSDAVVRVSPGSIEDLVARIASGKEEPVPSGGRLAETTSLGTVDILPKSLGGVSQSLRPQMRPGWFQPAQASVPRAVVDVAAANLQADTPMVQLGAFESANIAKSEWVRISAIFGTFFDGKSRVVQRRATSGGKVFYRLRAVGFADMNAARRFCSALKAENTDCIRVAAR